MSDPASAFLVEFTDMYFNISGVTLIHSPCHSRSAADRDHRSGRNSPT